MSNQTETEVRWSRLEQEPFVNLATHTGLLGGARSFGEIWTHRELLGRLVLRELKARYKDSSLGIVWSLFRPLAQLLIYYFAIGKVLGASRGTPDFAIFVFVGLTMWTLFSEIVSASTVSILANAGLVKKVYLPREIFPLAAVGSALVNFGIQLIVLVIGIITLSTSPFDPGNLGYAVVAILTLVLFSTSIGLLLSAVNVYLRDIQHFVEIAMLLLFWASPVVYSFKFVHNQLHGNWIEQIYLANPVTIAVLGFQKAVWASGSAATGVLTQYWPPDLILRMVVTSGVSIVLLLISQRVFSRLQGNFAQEL